MSELEDKINAVLGDPKQMEQITKLAKSFMGGGTPGKAAEPEPKGEEDPFASLGIDGATLQRLGRLLRQGGAEKPQERALPQAMRPYLSEKRRSKINSAVLSRHGTLNSHAFDLGSEFITERRHIVRIFLICEILPFSVQRLVVIYP